MVGACSVESGACSLQRGGFSIACSSHLGGVGHRKNQCSVPNYELNYELFSFENVKSSQKTLI